MLTDTFEIATGSMVGRLHLGQNGLLKGQNNQDAYAVHQDSAGLIMVVCDGCGSEPFSEFGSRLGADLLVAALRTQLARGIVWGDPSQHAEQARISWERVRQDVLAQLRVLAITVAGQGSFSEYVRSRMLFTAVAAVVTPEVTTVASIGDGFIALNGELTRLGPFPNNTPPYFVYPLVDTEFSAHPEQLKFQVAHVVPTSEVRSLLVATDGLEDLLACEVRELPGTTEKFGPLSQFWEKDLYFKNRDAIRRRLAIANSEQRRLNRQSGELVTALPLLTDDTTLAVLRRC